MAPSLQDDFDDILAHIEEEDYDRCTSSALLFLKTYTRCDEAKTYLPYAEFFKLFADAYHTWQGSYHYTPIRGTFRMASKCLQKLPAEGDQAKVVKGLETLCDMLVQYTWCENSAINNDPFALKDHSQKAIDFEMAGLEYVNSYLREKRYLYLERIVSWLRKYLEKNLYLHTGLNACARVYSSIMRDRACSEADFDDQIGRAEEAFQNLSPLSSELSSELNAHIRHVRQHYERLMPQPEFPTFLRVRSGKLVLSLSAACDRAGVRHILDVDRTDSDLVLDSFKDKVIKEFERLGFDADNIRPTQLVDIFETSFGEKFLKSLTFDIRPLEDTRSAGASIDPAPRLKLTVLDERTSDRDTPRKFDLETHVTLSALGACTVAFEMAINDKLFPDGLSVEEIRVLESCICPHAGQVQLEIKHDCDRSVKPSALHAFLCRWCPGFVCRRMGRWLKCDRTVKPFASPVKFLDRVNVTTIEETIEPLRKRASTENDTVLGEKVEALRKELEDYRGHALADAHGTTASDRKTRGTKICQAVNSVIECVKDPEHVKDLLTCCQRHTRLAEFAEELLGAIGQAFRSEIVEWRKRSGQESLAEDEVWNLRPDLGWYAYLYATRIDEVTTELTPVREAAAFRDIQEHRDTLGLVIDQREARASFDDWRFMTLKASPEDNLAHVRSHASDAFYTSEFQTFFYFPDDPQYLVDQYEATVELILRLNVGLRFYNTMAESLTNQIRQDEATSASRWIRRVGNLERDLRRIRHLRVEANELRNLVFKAGISRYQDHGKLMKRILDEMNVETVAVLADRHLGHLEDLSQEIIERLRSTRVKVLSFVGILVSSLVGASVTKDFFDAAFNTQPEGQVTFKYMLIVLVTSLIGGGILWILGKPPSEK